MVALPDQRRGWSSPVAIAIGGGFALLLGAALLLWAHYGTTVFYEMILAGIAACF